MPLELKQIVICKVSLRWYEILNRQYEILGSTVVNCWRATNDAISDALLHLEPGSMVMFMTENMHTDFKYKIVGGGFFTGFRNLKPDDAWDVYGTRNGCLDYEQFLDAVKEESGSADANINSLILSNIFFFDPRKCVHVPEELVTDFDKDSRFVFNMTDPIAQYLHSLVMVARKPLVNQEGRNFQGMYFMAAHANSRDHQAIFDAKVNAAYNFCCAITGTRVSPVLEVAHIKPFFDTKFQTVQNGILLRSDLHKLFSAGFITLDYRSISDIRVKTSKQYQSIFGNEYQCFDGKNINLPEDINLRPLHEYITWHNENRFEHWRQTRHLC